MAFLPVTGIQILTFRAFSRNRIVPLTLSNDVHWERKGNNSTDLNPDHFQITALILSVQTPMVWTEVCFTARIKVRKVDLMESPETTQESQIRIMNIYETMESFWIYFDLRYLSLIEQITR